MKKLIASAIVVLFTISTIQVNAQAVSKEIKKEKETAHKEMKAEKKKAHKALRKLEGTEVSTRSKDSFYSDFGKVDNAKWKRGTEFDEVTFTKGGKTQVAFYDYDSKLVGTTSKAAFTDLPAKAIKEINAKFKDYVKGDVIMYDDNESNDSDMLLYGQQFEGADHYFVALNKAGKETILMVNMDGTVSFFKKVTQ